MFWYLSRRSSNVIRQLAMSEKELKEVWHVFMLLIIITINKNWINVQTFFYNISRSSVWMIDSSTRLINKRGSFMIEELFQSKA